MKQLLLPMMAIIFILSCKKHHDSPHPVLSPTRTALLAHPWVQDSAATIFFTGERNVIHRSPRPIVTYALDYYTTNNEGQTNHDTTFYDYGEPDTIYYWYQNQKKNINNYFVVDNVTDKALVIRFTGNPVAYEWYQAK